MSVLPTRRAADITAVDPGPAWMIENLWTQQAVGIIGGEPKCGKSFLALDLAVSVASGRPCLRRFPVCQTGPVLIYAAEDGITNTQIRLKGIAAAADVPLAELDIHLITAPALRLDIASDRTDLLDTVAAIRPRLLILDPFVRLHQIDENAVSEVAPLLSFLRHLQRKFDTAVILVHHARKGAAGVRGGQALRGSSELHAWGDSNLYLRRRGSHIHLSIEHRAAASPDDVLLEIATHDDNPALRVVEQHPVQQSPAKNPVQLIEKILQNSNTTMSQRQLRTIARLRAQTVGKALQILCESARVEKTAQGYRAIS